jgi:molybdate transport repressor ModE-like protein
MEQRLGTTLVKRSAGGLHGGGALLTKEAKEFLRKYEFLEDGVNEMLDKKFIEVLGNGKSE